MARSTKKIGTVARRLKKQEVESLIGNTEMKHCPTTDDERASMLDKTVWSYDFSWPEILLISSYMHTFEVQENGLVFQEQSDESYMCLLISGGVAVIKRDSSEGMKTVASMGKGRTFGEMSVVDARPRSATIRATKPTKVLLLTRRGLDRMILEQPAIAARFCLRMASIISQRLRRTSGLLVDFLAD